MPRTKESDDLMRVHVVLARGDWLMWCSLFSESPGPSKALRIVMRDYLKRIDAVVEEKQRKEREKEDV